MVKIFVGAKIGAGNMYIDIDDDAVRQRRRMGPCIPNGFLWHLADARMLEGVEREIDAAMTSSYAYRYEHRI